MIKHSTRLFILFLIFSVIYFLLEYLFRGSTFIIMGLIGGFTAVLVELVNEIIPRNIPLLKQGLIACIIITLVELISGLLINQNYVYWDYRPEFCNFYGQICLRFCCVWYMLGIINIVLDDILRWWLFGEPKPHYRLI